MVRVTRREFLKSSVTASVVTGGFSMSALPSPSPKSAVDFVTLGNSGVEVTRLALGTGTFGGRIQRELPQKDFTKIVRHAYDRGIRFFESADNYREMHEKLAIALKGIPRDSYKLMTKFRWREADKPFETIDRLRAELNTDYFDILLLHCVRTTGWAGELQQLRDTFSEAKEKKIVLAHGASCHGLLPLRDYPDDKWLDVVLVRINHDGARMDNLRDEVKKKGELEEVLEIVKKVHDQGTGVIGMKLIGEGQFKDANERRASLKYVFGLGTVDAVTIGYKNTDEVDEAIQNIDIALNS